MFAELVRVDIVPSEAIALSVEAPSSTQFFLEWQSRPTSSLNSLRPQLMATCQFRQRPMSDELLALEMMSDQVRRQASIIAGTLLPVFLHTRVMLPRDEVGTSSLKRPGIWRVRRPIIPDPVSRSALLRWA